MGSGSSAKGFLGHMGLRGKISVPVIASVALMVGLMTWVTASKVRRSAELEARSKSEEIAYRYANEVQAEVEKSLYTARGMAHTLSGLHAAHATDREAVNRFLREILEKNPQLLGVWCGWEPNAFDGKDLAYTGKPGHDGTGRFIPYWNRGGGSVKLEPLVDYDKAGAGDYYQVAKKTLEETVVEPYSYAVNGKDVMMTSVAIPIMDGDRFLGVAGIDIALDSLQKLSEAIKPYGDGRAAILTGKGTYVAHPNLKLVTKTVQDAFPSESGLGELIAKGQVHRFSFYDSAMGGETFNVVVPVRLGDTKHPWAFQVSVPMSEVLKASNQLLMFQVAGSAVMLLVLAGIIFWLSSRISRPLDDARQKLGESASRVDSNSNELDQLSQRVASASSQQAAAIQQTVSSLDEINAMVQRSLDAAGQSAKVAGESREMAEQGHTAVARMIEAIREIDGGNGDLVREVESGNQRLGEIVQLIQTIGDKTRVINDIVFQTKLLSFNASVEAARAGEHGKGFAVVAEEVGNLAQMSGRAAKEISDLLTNSTETVNRMTAEMKTKTEKIAHESRQKIETGTRVAEECSGALEKIVATGQTVMSLVSEIERASQEQARGVDEITKAMQQLDEVTHSTAEMSQQTAHHARGLLHEAGDLKDVVQTLESEIRGGAHAHHGSAHGATVGIHGAVDGGKGQWKEAGFTEEIKKAG